MAASASKPSSAFTETSLVPESKSQEATPGSLETMLLIALPHPDAHLNGLVILNETGVVAADAVVAGCVSAVVAGVFEFEFVFDTPGVASPVQPIATAITAAAA